MVLIHFENFTFAFDGQKMLKNMRRMNEEDFQNKYVDDGNAFIQDNEEKIGRIQNKLWISVALGWFQFVPWIFMLMEI